MSCLLGLVLAFQVAGLHLPSARAAAPTDAKTVALASLAAAIGHTVTFCEHGGFPARPGDPADPAGCEHCIFCHFVAAGVAMAPVATNVVVRSAVSTEVERSREDVAFVRARHVGNATPRGPPKLV